jgi:hypothetical protein
MTGELGDRIVVPLFFYLQTCPALAGLHDPENL